MTTFINISHPDLDGVARVTREAFEGLWSDKGWVEVDEEAPVTTDDDVVFDPRSARKVDLVNEANRRGLDPVGTIPVLRSRILNDMEAQDG